jgi:hypothetical protein
MLLVSKPTYSFLLISYGYLRPFSNMQTVIIATDHKADKEAMVEND